MAGGYERVTKADALGDGDTHAAEVGGWPVLLGRDGGRVFALVNRCSHAGSPLEGGKLKRGTLTCPLHGARFDVATGACQGPYRPLATIEVRIEEGWISVAVPEEPFEDKTPPAPSPLV